MKRVPKTDKEMYEAIGDGIRRRITVRVTIKSRQWLKRLMNNDRRARRMTANMLTYHDVEIEIMHLVNINHSESDYRYLAFGHDRIPFTWPIQAFRRDSIRFFDKDGKPIQ